MKNVAPFTWFDRNLNAEQQHAVGAIVRARQIRQGVPYIIFGPPGTGKTKTMCEAVLQMYRAHHCKVLVTAPSNTAADVLLEKLSSVVSRSEMLRFMAYNRSAGEVSIETKNYTYSFEEKERVFSQPPLKKFLEYNIVVATCCMAAKLYNLGVPSGHFDVIFIDEAGHAVEPEVVAAFSSLYAKGQQVVLAGDPLQLGPVVRSIANKCGLEQSYLERLGERAIYRSNTLSPDQNTKWKCQIPEAGYDNLGYDTRVITKLVRNYRSHSDILALPNKLFYEGHLEASKLGTDPYRRSHTLTEWSELPAKGFPMIFHGIHGTNEQEANSPSWFNTAECTQVLSYVQNLVGGRGLNKVEPCDIGIVTPYAKQVEKLSKLLRQKGIKVGGNDVMIGSAEKFQGQERRVIIISTVRSSESFLEFDAKFNLGFVSNPKRFNVAVTRAQALLIVVGNSNILGKDACWRELLWKCFDNGAYTGMPPPSRTTDEEEERAGALLQTFEDLHLDADSSDDDNHGPSRAEQQEGPEWRDAD